MKETIVRITTADTKKTYEFPNKNNPQLWEVTMETRCVQVDGSINPSSSIKETLYYERQSLVDAALLPQGRNDSPPPIPPRTLEDMFAEILEHMGVFPS